jgi:apolipoprotein D and lipocalin family protein
LKGRKDLDVVPSIDLARYTGRWYEIARLPNSFQKACTGEVTAEYSLIESQQLRVINQCRLSNGEFKKAEGIARMSSEGGQTSKLKVRFAPTWLSWLSVVWGDYWVIELASDYSYAVVGTPDRKYLWILSRTPQMEPAIFDQITRRSASRGFDSSKLLRTRQAAQPGRS